MTTNKKTLDAETNDEGQTFEEWYRDVDLECSALCGLGIDDLADGPSYDCWSGGYTPAEYARERLEDEGFPF